MTFTWAVELLTTRNTTRSQCPTTQWHAIILTIKYSSILIQTSGLLLNPWLQCDNIAENWRSVGNSTLVGEAKVDNAILEPAITLFTDKWTPGVTTTRAFSALNSSGAYHVRLNITGEVVNITTSVPLYYRYHDLVQDVVVSSICVQSIDIFDSATLEKSSLDKMKVVISVASDER